MAAPDDKLAIGDQRAGEVALLFAAGWTARNPFAFAGQIVTDRDAGARETGALYVMAIAGRRRRAIAINALRPRKVVESFLA